MLEAAISLVSKHSKEEREERKGLDNDPGEPVSVFPAQEISDGQ